MHLLFVMIQRGVEEGGCFGERVSLQTGRVLSQLEKQTFRPTT